ncbi:MAG: excinuclease ABC subunit UvrA [Bacteroidota bacterium]|nr:excinuclease ABC subunit UvrA [Bacteroidota bacterium]
MNNNKLIVKGARVHNLKNIDVEMPRDKLIVITGLSGSGKSSLAFDTIYAEGQRRYIESLSAYARQFLGVMERPDVDNIDGLSPAISIEQKSVSQNPRSTVGTVTEIYDYLRLLFARVGVQHCSQCGLKVEKQNIDAIIDSVMSLPENTRVQILAPVVRGRKGHYRELFEEIVRDGFLRVRIDGEGKEIYKGMQADRYKIHNIEIVIDRIVLQNQIRSRVADSIETALNFGSGVVIVNTENGDSLYSIHFACSLCGISYEDPAPNSFSFNSPYGYCPTCSGLGENRKLDVNLIIPDESKTINDEGIAALGKPRQTWLWSQIRSVAKKNKYNFDTPINEIPKKFINILLNGAGDEKFEVEYTYNSGRKVVYKHRYNGILHSLQHYYDETSSNHIRQWVEAYMSVNPCGDCNGGRLRKESLAVKITDLKTNRLVNIADVVRLSIKDAKIFFQNLKLSERQSIIANQISGEINKRLEFLLNVGLDYLTLDRPARTLSGGEGQRIRLATQIGSQLVGVLYVLDEPSIGLHQRDNIKLINSLKKLRDLGNTIIVVEHDKEMIQSADFVVDLGPGAGEHGGYLVTSGKPKQLKLRNDELIISGNGIEPISYTAHYLANERKIDIPKIRREGNGLFITLRGCSGNNLKNIDAKIPLGKLICVTGVSGSGKSTLIIETLYRILSRKFYRSNDVPLKYKKIEGLQNIDKVIDIDQNPIGRTPRSNPATYTGLFTLIRDLFTQLPEAKIRGYKAGRFSFNVKGGRCEECEGDGVRKIEMNFLPGVYVQCEVCKGKRYSKETLEVLYKGKSIADILNMTVEEALSFFSEIPKIVRKLQTLFDVGMSYIRLGQQATTLSGGEAQRVKLSTELSKIGTGNTLYILDEPTTGLHFEDIRMLLSVLNKLVEKGNTVVIIEHNMDVIKCADWIMDLGPGGGDEGGEIVAQGSPEEIVKIKRSYTGMYLKDELFGI